jgi:hypothetical protein
MGYNARNDEIRDNVTRMRRWEAQRNALATVRRFNATLSAKGYVWFWPKIRCPHSKTSSVINCDSCGTVVDLDLRAPRDPEAQSALRCAMCTPALHGYGCPRIIALARPADLTRRYSHPSDVGLCEQAQVLLPIRRLPGRLAMLATFHNYRRTIQGCRRSAARPSPRSLAAISSLWMSQISRSGDFEDYLNSQVAPATPCWPSSGQISKRRTIWPTTTRQSEDFVD